MGQEVRRCPGLPFLEGILLIEEKPQICPHQGFQHRRRDRQVLGEMARQRSAFQLNPQEIIKRKHAESLPIAFPTLEGVPQRHKGQQYQLGIAKRHQQRI